MAYTILAGTAPGWVGDGAQARRVAGRTVVVWRRGGRACVLSARDVAAAKLLALAVPSEK